MGKLVNPADLKFAAARLDGSSQSIRTKQSGVRIVENTGSFYLLNGSSILSRRAHELLSRLERL